MNGEHKIWEEKSYTDQLANSLKNVEKDNCDTTIEIKSGLIEKGWNETKTKEYKKNWYQKNKIKISIRQKEYSLKNKKRRLEYQKQWFQENKKRIREKNQDPKIKERKRKWRKQWYHKNKEKLRVSQKEYRDKNRERNKEYKKQWYQEHKSIITLRNTKRRKVDMGYKLSCYLRSRITRVIRGNYKSGSAINDLGCSIESFKQYLEKQFVNEMSWENYGEWHIDHIKPLSSFDLTDRNQFLEACHYTNMQPLWAEDNLRKGDKII